MSPSYKLYYIIIISLLSPFSLIAQKDQILSHTDFIKPSPLPRLQDSEKFAQNEIIVTFRKNIKIFSDNNSSKNEAKTTISQKCHMNIKKRLGKHKFKMHPYKKLGIMHFKSQNYSTDELLAYFRSDEMKPYVESVSKNNIMVPYATSDVYYNKQWAIENRGQAINNIRGAVDADMDVPEAWTRTKGEQSVIVAVLDTGIDYHHSDLQDNMWNGAVNHGYDFAGDNDGNNDDDPMPDEPFGENGHYHGTHVAGILGAVGDNSNGISGVAQHISIMALKVFRPNGYGYTSDVLEALEYVSQRIEQGDNIVAVNASYGGLDGHQGDPLHLAIKKLGTQGVLVCAAAGNESTNIDTKPSYPASYNTQNIIVVAASDQNDKLTNFSNYGAKTVDIVAPGINILSTYPDSGYAYMEGTSMATPNVSATVALIASLYADTTVEERKAMILNNVDKIDALQNKVSSEGRLNLNSTLKELATSNNHLNEKKPIEEIDLPKDNNKLTIELTNQPIQFTTLDHTIMKLKSNEKEQLEGTILSNGKVTTLLLNTPHRNLEIDAKGNLFISFEEESINLKIDSHGNINSTFPSQPEAITQQGSFPLGTTVTMDKKHIQFTSKLLKTINF